MNRHEHDVIPFEQRNGGDRRMNKAPEGDEREYLACGAHGMDAFERPA